MLVAAQMTRTLDRILKRPQNSQPLVYTELLPVTQSNTNLAVAVKVFCNVIKVQNEWIFIHVEKSSRSAWPNDMSTLNLCLEVRDREVREIQSMRGVWQRKIFFPLLALKMEELYMAKNVVASGSWE